MSAGMRVSCGLVLIRRKSMTHPPTHNYNYNKNLRHLHHLNASLIPLILAVWCTKIIYTCDTVCECKVKYIYQYRYICKKSST